MAFTWYERLLGRFARATSARRVWYRWPFPIAMASLVGLRSTMRERNLFDCETAPLPADPPRPDIKVLSEGRTVDGSYNDLGAPRMGMAGARFGRNVPISETFGENSPGLYDPNPRVVSNRLLARREFVPVPHLNMMVPAWLQFMVHDWLSHGTNNPNEGVHRVDVPPGDNWPFPFLSILKSKPDELRDGDDGRPATYANTETHWWDGSQVYGSTIDRLRMVRGVLHGKTKVLPNGKLLLGDDDLLPVLPVDEGAKNPETELAGVNGNWWIGLSVMHTIFVREHNTIIDRLRVDYPKHDGEWLFQKARLINAALMAKIHTVEWTPALMNSPEGRLAMRANWWGLLGERFTQAYGRRGEGEILSGIPGTPADHHSAPYSMTEEFTAVYRMHSLIPDEFSFRSHVDDRELHRTDLQGVMRSNARRLYVQHKLAFEDVLYSLATSNPGALVLHNFPNGMRQMPESPHKVDIQPHNVDVFTDLATNDILRDRERGIPRYCAFRRHLGMPVPKDFDELTTDADWRRELEEVYGTVEKVDLLVGTLAESKASPNGTPPGFGFSDTAFRIFILQASRRLKSDRFFCEDFRPEVYTPAGFCWVRDNSFRTVLARQMPGLAPHFGNLRNVFFPWRKGQPT
ncbi:peroxidase [Sinorhizobium medicae]|nr:peroxidase [Sinorhizobium medicae]MDX0475210.1 peroxidase [Sinorhizobium medicae]